MQKYELTQSENKDTEQLIQYKLNTIYDYAENLTKEEEHDIQEYVRKNVPIQLKDYNNIIVENKIVGCVLIEPKDDGILLDEIYIEKEYRNKGIGRDIIKNILSSNSVVYLWVYKQNLKAIKLYKKIGFKIVDETDTRYYMKFN